MSIWQSSLKGFAKYSPFLAYTLVLFHTTLTTNTQAKAHLKETKSPGKTLKQKFEHQQKQYHELMDFMENAVTPIHWVDSKGYIIWANQAELDLLGYTREEYMGHPIAEFHVDEATIQDMLYRLTRNETLKAYEARLRCKDGSIRHVLINSNVYWEEGKFSYTRCFTQDITDRKVFEERLHSLQDIVVALSQVNTIEQIAQVMKVQGFPALGAYLGVLALVNKDKQVLEPVVHEGVPEGFIHQYRSIPLTTSLPITDAIRLKQPIWLATAEAYQHQYPQIAANTLPLTQSQSVLAFPLIVGEDIIGAVGLSFTTPKLYDTEELSFIVAVVNQCAQALHRIHLYEDERQQRLLAQALQKTAIAVSNSLELSEVLDEILASIGYVVPHDAAKIILVGEQGTNTLKCKGYKEHGLDAFEAILTNSPNLIERLTRLHQIYGTHKPLLISNTRHDLNWLDIPEALAIQSFVGVPILSQDKVIGFIGLDSLTPNFFTPTHVSRLQAFAAQTATAIQNAQLYQQAQAAAAIEERQRLARDLHDAVSQTLFASTTIAEALPRLWERDPHKSLERLAKVVTLNQSAMAEMRTLLLELRPETILKTDMQMLLNQLVTAAKGRTTIGADLQIDATDLTLPPDVHVAFYRIAQESINNILKHSHATHFSLHLDETPTQVRLSISDNGQGFNTSRSFAGIGLRSLQERANSIGASLHMTSEPGQGTAVDLLWEKPN